jgi:prepilin-type N-terminal cleavage/methylation domain-containing protein
MRSRDRGFTIMELLVAIAIIAVLATVAFVTLGTGRDKGRDAKRKADLAQIGQFMAAGCFLPADGAGTYDLVPLLDEVKAKNSQAARFLPKAPKDPKSGTATQANYAYAVSEDGKHCVLYANLEYASEDVTLEQLTEPTPGGGTGVLKAASPGWNGTDRYYQISN